LLTLVNPRDTQVFGHANILMTGVARRHYVEPFEGCLSIKGVLRGVAEWRTPAGRYLLYPDTLLTLNDRQTYSLSIDGLEQTETFCVFFPRGVVEDAVWAILAADEVLLERPQGGSFGFAERIRSNTGEVGRVWRSLAWAYRKDLQQVDATVEYLALALAREAVSGKAASARLPSAKASTRQEIMRRVNIARDAMEADIAFNWSLADLGSKATMSPYHFQRCFREIYGETPKAYLSRRRLERAASLLRLPGGPNVTEVCHLTGYSSLGSFSAAFRARYGQTPSEVRKRS
jgi:AraC family transcriptional regulator